MGTVLRTRLPTNLKTVLAAYADNGNDDGTSIFPGEDEMVLKTSYSRSTVRKATAELLSTGLLIQRKRGHRGQRAEWEIDAELLKRVSVPLLKGSGYDTLSELAETRPFWDSEKGEWVSSTSERVSYGRERVSSTTRKGVASDTPNVMNLHEPPRPEVASDNSCQHPALIEGWYQERCRDCGQIVVDEIWDVVVDTHGSPAHKSESGKFNKAVSILREAKVTPEEYPSLVLAYTTKYDKLQPALMTVVERVGEMRHFVAKGPIRSVSLDQVADAQWLASKDRKALA